VSATAWAVLGVAALIAALDWVAVARRVRWLEYVTKSGFMLALIALAAVIQPVNPTQRSFFLVALALGLISDVFLMLPQDLFLLGLAAALVEHLAYIAGFRTRDLHLAYLLGAVAIASVSAAVVLPAIYRALRRNHPKLVVPVLAYVAVFVVMVASAGGTGARRCPAVLLLGCDPGLEPVRQTDPSGPRRQHRALPRRSGVAGAVPG
jgi:uncharacterized membrane protein YhhN